MKVALSGLLILLILIICDFIFADDPHLQELIYKRYNYRKKPKFVCMTFSAIFCLRVRRPAYRHILVSILSLKNLRNDVLIGSIKPKKELIHCNFATP